MSFSTGAEISRLRTPTTLSKQYPDPAEIAALQAILGTEAEMPVLAEECAGTMVTPESVSSAPAQVDCQAKRYCTQMKTCEEARAYLTQCEIKSLDRDGDGIPCESLCN